MKTLKVIGCCVVMLMLMAGSANAVLVSVAIVGTDPNGLTCAAEGLPQFYEAGSPEFREAIALAMLQAEECTRVTGNFHHVQIIPVNRVY